MAATWILKLPQVDKPKEPILVHVIQKQGTSLDLDLTATDGSDAYKGKVRERNLSKFQSKTYDGTNEEWSAMMQYALVSKQTVKISSDLIKTLEVDTCISSRKARSLTINLRSRIEDITHKLGSIELSFQEDTQDIDLFTWACLLAEQRTDLEEEVSTLTAKSKTAKTANARLQQQLDDLVSAKQDHEDQLLTKFSALLNEKKLKIRDYQRTLKTSKIDEKVYSEIKAAVAPAKQSNSASGNGKRKRHKDKDQTQDDGEESSDGFEAMDVDNIEDEETADEDQDEAGRVTPLRSQTPETETASEDENKGAKGQGRTTTTTDAVAAGTAKKENTAPPARQLPFQKRKHDADKKIGPNTGKQLADNDETESEDDEL